VQDEIGSEIRIGEVAFCREKTVDGGKKRGKKKGTEVKRGWIGRKKKNPRCEKTPALFL